MLFSSTCRLVKGGEDDKCKLVIAAIEAKLPYLHRLVCMHIHRVGVIKASYCQLMIISKPTLLISIL